MKLKKVKVKPRALNKVQNTFTHTQMQITNLKTKHKQQGEEAKIEIKHVVVELAVHYCLSCKTIINHLLCKY